MYKVGSPIAQLGIGSVYMCDRESPYTNHSGPPNIVTLCYLEICTASVL
jgi:hypothetical protein